MAAVVFSTPDGATEALTTLDELEKKEGFKVRSATRFMVDANGKIHRKAAGAREPGKGAGEGLLIGAMAALLPGIGLLAGVAVGAAIGLVGGGLKHRNVPKEYVEQFQAQLKPGTSGLAVELQPENVTDFNHAMEGLGGKVSVLALYGEGDPQYGEVMGIDRAFDHYSESFQEPDPPMPKS